MEITLLFTGGDFGENSVLDKLNNKIKIIDFKVESGKIEIVNITCFESIRHHVKDQSAKYFKGSFLPALSQSASVRLSENCVLMYGGFRYATNTCSDDIFVFSDLNTKSPECSQIGGQEAILQSGYSTEELRDARRVQRGELPGPSSGHTLVNVESQVILIGGHFRTQRKEISANHTWYNKQRKGVFYFDTKTNVWQKCTIIGDSNALVRSNFSNCTFGNKLILCGGQVYSENNVQKLSVLELVVVVYNSTNRELSVTKIKMDCDFLFDSCISSASMSYINCNNLILSGGCTKLNRSNHVLAFDLNEKKCKQIKLSEDMIDFTRIFGSSSFKFGSHSILFFGGSSGQKSVVGRVILNFSKLEEASDIKCDYKDLCKYVPSIHPNPVIVTCANCNCQYHYNLCDVEAIKKGVLRIPKKPKCSKCKVLSKKK